MSGFTKDLLAAYCKGLSSEFDEYDLEKTLKKSLESGRVLLVYNVSHVTPKEEVKDLDTMHPLSHITNKLERSQLLYLCYLLNQRDKYGFIKYNFVKSEDNQMSEKEEAEMKDVCLELGCKKEDSCGMVTFSLLPVFEEQND